MNGNVTLQQVAAHAGVSRATASLVVRGKGRVSQLTRDRVFASMAELGYVYDRVAASLRTQRAATVGVVVTNIDNPFFAELILGVEERLQQEGVLTLLAVTRDEVGRQEAAITALLEQRVSGLALVPASGTPGAFMDRLEAAGVGTVCMTRFPEDRPVSYVGPDDVLGGALSAGHLISHGCRSLAYAGGPAQMRSRRDRIAGVRRAMAEAGMGEQDLVEVAGETSGQGGRAVGDELLDLDTLPEGIVCHSDSVAFGLYRALHDRGRAGETRVIGYDDIPDAQLWEPQLTSVSVQGHQLGEWAAQALVDRIGDPGRAPVTRLVEPTLALRRSCGCHGV